MKEDQRGYIVVETIGTFLLFVLLVISILSLVNIVTLQAQVHYALTQAAETLSIASYPLEVTGMAEHIMKLDENADDLREEADAFKTDINGIIEGINSLSPGEVEEFGEAAFNRASGWAKDTIANPQETIRIMSNFALNEGKGAVVKELVRPLVGRYLRNGTMSGDEYLKSVNVAGGLEGLKFYDFSLTDFENLGNNDTQWLDKNGDIKIVVRYDINYKFGALPLPFDPKLSVTQSVKTKAWLGGSGEGLEEGP